MICKFIHFYTFLYLLVAIPVAQSLLSRMPESLRDSIFERYTLSDTTMAPDDKAVVSRIFEMAVEGNKSAIKMRDFLVCVGKMVEERIRKLQASLRSDREAFVRSDREAFVGSGLF